MAFLYDAAERLTQIDQYGTATHFKAFTYGNGTSAADRSRGKVKTAQRYNYVLAPFNATVLITDTYTYGGDQGRVSIKDTSETFQGTLKETFRQTYAWNDLGDLASQTYPDCIAYCTPSTPRTVTYGYTDGRVSSIPGFLTSVTYHLSGLPSVINRANGTYDGWYADANFTGRVSNMAGFTNNWNPVPFGMWTTGSFQYDGAGNIKKMGNSSYVYDAVSRLVGATVYPGPYSDGTAQTQSYTYDAFGNQQSRTTNGVTVNTPTYASSNHLTGANYDGAGNQLSWNGATYSYDALSMVKQMVNGGEDWRYIYDASDERFWSYRVGGGGSIWTPRGIDGKVLRSYNAHINWSNLTDYVYREGTLTASVANGAVSHLHTDHLGTPRLISSASGRADQLTFHSYYPFGEEIYYGSTYTDRLRFTGHELDLANATSQADDLYYMHARHESPMTGRFLSMDPGAASSMKPQSWNRYGYVRGNPLIHTDPTGELTAARIADTAQDILESLSHSAAYDCADAPLIGLSCATAILNTATLLSGFVEPLKWGDALGQAVGSGAGPLEFFLAAQTDNYRGAALLAPLVAGLTSQASSTAAGATEVVQRAMSGAELDATRGTGLLRGGRAGTHYVSDAVNSNALRARQRLALERTPEFKVTLRVPEGVFSAPTKIAANFKMPGGGMQRTATGNVPVEILKVFGY